MKKCMEKNSMVNKEEVNLFCKNYYGYTMEEADKDIGYWMEKNYELKKENKELHNKIDEISDFIKENKVKRYRPIEGEEYDEEIVLDEDDITCLERIINDEYDYENR